MYAAFAALSNSCSALVCGFAGALERLRRRAVFGVAAFVYPNGVITTHVLYDAL